MTLGEKIKYLRKKKGMTLQEVADIVGVGNSTVHKWEIGYIENMRRDKIALLAKALDTTPAFLMGWEEFSSNTVNGNNNIIGNGNRIGKDVDDQEQALLDIFRKLDTIGKAKLIAYADSLVK